MNGFIRSFVAGSALCAGVTASAATLGSDNASNATYSTSWSNGSNGGSGFSAWTLSSGSNSGWFIGDSTFLQPTQAGGNVNTTGAKSFGFYGRNGSSAEASGIRTFAGGALSQGQAFSIDLAVNYRTGFKGVDIRDASSNTILNLNTGGDQYTVTANGSTNSIFSNSYDSNTKFSLVVFQSSLTAGQWKVTRGGGQTGTVSGTFSGLANGFKAYIGGTTNGNTDQENLYVNNLAITPEPGSAIVLGLAGLTALGRRRRANVA